MQGSQYCLKHNQPFAFIDRAAKNSEQKERLGDKVQIINEEYNQQQQQKIHQAVLEGDKFIAMLYKLIALIYQHKETIQSGFEKISQQIFDYISLMNNQREQEKKTDEISLDQTLKYNNIIGLQNNIKVQLQEKLQEIGKFNILDDLFSLLNGTYERKFQYELLQEQQKIVIKNCYCQTFNNDSSLLFVGCTESIYVYEFRDQKVGKEIQVLTHHKDLVVCLMFMKKFNYLVSGSQDCSIIIWKFEEDNLWKKQYILKEHGNFINSIILNELDDIIISGSSDKTIKFWGKGRFGFAFDCKQTINVEFKVYCLSLNKTQKILIACGDQSNIKVLKNQIDNWAITQTIQVEEFGYRLCFFNDDAFAFQPEKEKYLLLYNYDNQNQQFKKSKSIEVQNCERCYLYFPCQFIEAINIVIIKHGKYLNFFAPQENGEFRNIQSIEFSSSTLFGTLSSDGKILVTWDEKQQKEIELRILKQIA